jgi:hypothetical protein
MTIETTPPKIGFEKLDQAIAPNMAKTPSKYITPTLKVSSKISTTGKTDILNSVCSNTGIVMGLVVPSIPGVVLEYTSPLSYFSNVSGLIKQGEKYLSQLETQILAGLWITTYKHYDLIDIAKQNSSMLNAMIRTAGKQILIDSLLLSSFLDVRKANRCPKFSLSYETHKEHSTSFGPALREYTKIINDILFPEYAIQPVKEYETVPVYAISNTSNSKKRRPLGPSDIEREIESDIAANKRDIAANKREAKELLSIVADNMMIPVPFISLLKTAFTGKNLVSMTDDLRNKMAAKLRTYAHKETERLAKLLEDSKDPYADSVDEALDRASDHLDSIAKPARLPTLSEILAAKKEKRLREELQSNHASTNTVSNNSIATNTNISEQVAGHFEELFAQELSAQEEIEASLDSEDDYFEPLETKNIDISGSEF